MLSQVKCFAKESRIYVEFIALVITTQQHIHEHKWTEIKSQTKQKQKQTQTPNARGKHNSITSVQCEWVQIFWEKRKNERNDIEVKNGFCCVNCACSICVHFIFYSNFSFRHHQQHLFRPGRLNHNEIFSTHFHRGLSVYWALFVCVCVNINTQILKQ